MSSAVEQGVPGVSTSAMAEGTRSAAWCPAGGELAGETTQSGGKGQYDGERDDEAMSAVAVATQLRNTSPLTVIRRPWSTQPRPVSVLPARQITEAGRNSTWSTRASVNANSGPSRCSAGYP